MIDFLFIIVEQSLIHIPLVLGSYITFSLMKIPDLSIESAYLFGALFSLWGISIQEYGLFFSFLCALFLSMLGGALVGFSSSFLTFYGKLSPLLSSIVTIGLFHGIFQLLSSSTYISLASYKNSLSLLPFLGKRPEFFILLLVSAVLSFFFWYLLKTQLGHCFSIYGQNPLFFKQFRISDSYVFITGVTLANSLAGISGYLFAQTNNLIELNMGLGKSLFCIMAIILGKGFIKERDSLLIPLVGIFSYFILQQSLLKVGFNLKYFTALQALIVLIAFVIMNRYNKKKISGLGI